jgi:hypothetical protein
MMSDYALHGNWQQLAWFEGLIAHLSLPLRAAFHSPGGVEVVLQEKDETSWVTLLQHHGEQLVGKGRLWSRNIDPPTEIEGELVLRTAGRTVSLVLFGDEKISWIQQGDLVSIPLSLRRTWDVIKLRYK